MARKSPELQPLIGTVYAPNNHVMEFSYSPTRDDYRRMGYAIEEASKATELGDSPIGAVIALPGENRINSNADPEDPNQNLFLTHTTEFTSGRTLAHAELNGMDATQRKYGHEIMKQAIVYTTAEPCAGCSYFLDQSNAGLVIAAAARKDAPEFFRQRDINIGEIWSDTTRKLTLVTGLRRKEAAALLTAAAKRH